MDTNFFAYLQQLELMAFFSGYPLLYAVVVFIAGAQPSKTGLKKRSITLLPFAYALVGTLFLGFQLKNLYPDYSIENIKLSMHRPGLVIWGLLSMLFWIPVLAKKPVLSLLHSLIFFFFLLKDLFLHLFKSIDKNILSNDMKIYTDSLLLNLGAFAGIVLLSFLFTRYKKKLNVLIL
jgi:hypothetical protein